MTTIESLRQKIAEYEVKISKIRISEEEHSISIRSELESYKSKLFISESEISRLRGQVTSLESRITAITKEQSSSIMRLHEEKSSFSSTITSLENTVSILKSEKHELEISRSALLERINFLESKMSTIEEETIRSFYSYLKSSKSTHMGSSFGTIERDYSTLRSGQRTEIFERPTVESYNSSEHVYCHLPVTKPINTPEPEPVICRFPVKEKTLMPMSITPQKK